MHKAIDPIKIKFIIILYKLNPTRLRNIRTEQKFKSPNKKRKMMTAFLKLIYLKK